MRLLSILAAALAAFGQAPGSISGRVVDLVTGEGLPGAQVSLGFGEVSTTAGENEPYQLEHLKPGEYHVTAQEAGDPGKKRWLPASRCPAVSSRAAQAATVAPSKKRAAQEIRDRKSSVVK